VIDVVSAVDFRVLDKIDLPFAPGFIVVDSSADEIFASGFGSGKVAVIDGRTEKVEEEVRKAMDAIEVDPVARLLYAGGPISSNNGIETEPIDVIKGVVSFSDHPGGWPAMAHFARVRFRYGRCLSSALGPLIGLHQAWLVISVTGPPATRLCRKLRDSTFLTEQSLGSE